MSGWFVLAPVSGRCIHCGVAEVGIYIDTAVQGRGIGKRLLQHPILCAEKAGY